MILLLLLFQAGVNQDKGFKSIHQLQYEEHTGSAKKDTVVKGVDNHTKKPVKKKELERFRLTFGTILTVFILFLMTIALIWVRRWFYSSYR